MSKSEYGIRLLYPNRILLFIFAVLFIVNTSQAVRVYVPEDVPNVQRTDANRYVSDPERMLTASQLSEADAILSQIRRATTAEGVAIIVSSIGELTPTEFCEKIFTSWGIGKKDKDNGFILLVAVDDRKAWIQTGYGMEGVLTDADCATLLREYMVPYMKRGETGEAVVSTLSAIKTVLEDPVAMEEIRSQEADNTGLQAQAISPEVLKKFMKLVALLIFIIGAVYFASLWFNSRGKTQYEKALLWKKSLLPMLAATILSGGAGLLYAAVAFLLYRYNRNGTHKCSNCGAKMKKLSEKEDNEKLTPSQDLEERLDTVDYDVWVCPDCGTVDKFAFKKNQNKYSQCPSCGTIAETLTEDHTIQPATTRREGIGERTYTCQYCNHKRKTNYRIPRKTDDAAVAAGILGAALGSSRRGGGGGGFGGGGFGGGHTGGGGGGASW